MKVKPEVDEEFLPMKRTWDKPFHLEQTRTTFLRLHKLQYWDNVKMDLMDGNNPHTMVITVNLTVNDIDHMIESLKGAQNALMIDLDRMKIREDE